MWGWQGLILFAFAGWLKALEFFLLVGKNYFFFVLHGGWLAEGSMAGFFGWQGLFFFFICGWLAEGLLAASRLVRGHGGTFVPLICQILDTL